jgi:NADH-quinone oxidoreductase subunit F
VAIRSIKRFAADWYFDHVFEPPKPFPKTKKEKVAVVGAGPTGLTCAYYLARVGYPVTVFEALPFGGGMLMVGVPEFRLPKKVVQKEIEYIEKRGVEIRYSTPINVNFTIDNLFKDGFKAVFIAAGAQKSQKVGVPGEDERLEGFYYGLSFLRDVKLGKEVKVGRKVAVIGGGNVAIDAARSSLRLGAKKVSILYRRTRDEMLASDEEIEAALDEGISIQYLIAPSEAISEAGKVVGLNCVTMQLGEPDESGRRRPIPIPGTEGIFETDTLIMAVGQAPDLSFLPPDSNLERTRWEMLAVNSNTLATNVPGVFAGGDFVTGPGNIIEAIAAGRRGAVAIDKYLLDDTSKVELYDPKEPIPEESVEAKLEGVEEEKPRVKMPVVPPEERVIDFREIELGFTEEKAREEAKRCLRCDLER